MGMKKDEDTDLVLEECPFCLGKNFYINIPSKDKSSFVVCQSCGCQGPIATTLKQAVAGWNLRFKKDLTYLE